MSTIPDGTAAVVDDTYRTMSHDEYVALARDAFGDNPMDWRFKCPACGDAASTRDFLKTGLDSATDAGWRCIGSRPWGRLVDPDFPVRGCWFVLSDRLPGPWSIKKPTGEVFRSFALDLPAAS